jgi:hypothetical protein
MNNANGANSGHVRVYQFASGSWTQLGQDIDGEAQNDYSGVSVSMSADGSIVAIGAHNNGSNGTGSGHVRVYQLVNGAWTQLGQDIDGEAQNDNSGVSVSMSADGTIVAIGAINNDGSGADAGHVRVYQLVNGAWTQLGQDIDGEFQYDNSGVSVSMSADGSIVAIGANFNGGSGVDAGHVRVYQLVNGAWTQLGQDIDGEAAGDRSGWSVSLSADGTIVAIGAYRNENGAGHVRVYQLVNGAWTLISDIDGEAANDWSGISVSLSADGTIVAIGAYGNDGNGDNSGHMRVFELIHDPFAYQWLRDGADITGATSSTYNLVDLDVGEPVSVRVSYTDDQGTPEAPVSSPTIAISNSGMTPTISGDAIVGNVLTTTSEKLLQGTLEYTWVRAGADIANSNASSYTLVAADAGKAMSVKVSTDIAGIAARTSVQTANVVYTPNVQNVVFSSTTNRVSGSFEIDAAQHLDPVTSITLHIGGVEHSSSNVRVRRTGKYSYSFEAKTESTASSIQIVAGEYGTHSEAAVQYHTSSTIDVDTSTRTSAESDIANAKVLVGASKNQRDIARASIASAIKQKKTRIPRGLTKNIRKHFRDEVNLFSNRETFNAHEELAFTRRVKVPHGVSGSEKREMNHTVGSSSFVVERAIDVDAAGVKSTKKRSFKTDVYEVSVTSGQSQKMSGFQENHMTLLVEGTGSARYLTQLKADDGVSKLPARGANKYMKYSSDLTTLLSASTEKSVNFVLIDDDISTLSVANHSSSFTSASWFSEYILNHTDSTWDTDASVKALEMGEYIRDNFVSESVLKDASGNELDYSVAYVYSLSTHTLSMSWNTFGETAAVSHELYANIPSASQVTAQIQQAYTNPELTDVTDSSNVVVISDANDALVGFTATMECVFHVTAANATLNVESGAAITVGTDCIFVFDHGVAPGATFQVMTVAADGSTLNAGSAKWYRLPQNTAFDSNNIAAYRSSAASTSITSAGLLTLNTPPSGSVSISGSVEEGATIGVDTTLITDAEQTVAELTFTYQWQMSAGTSNENFSNITNATNASYTIASDQSEVGRYIACVVTVNDGFVDYVATTPAQGIGNVNDAPTGLVVTGTPTLSYQLNADVSALSDADGLPDAGTFTYQWLRDGADITGATSSTYDLVDLDVGEPVSVRLSYTDAQGTAEAPVSSPTIAISDSGMTPVITGDAIEGEVLTATSGLQGSLVYTWLRDGADIANSNASSYTLVAADTGKAMSVRVSTDIAGIAARTSAATENVAALDALVNEFINMLSVTRTHTPSFRMEVSDRRITRGDGASLLDNLLAALKPNKSQSSEVSDLSMSKLADDGALKSSALKMVRGAMTEFMPVMDDGTGVLEGDHPDKAFYFELGYRSNADKLTVSSLGGIDKLPVYNSGTQKLNAAVVNGETVSQTGWDESIDMMRYASGNARGLKHAWFEMERDSCGILIKDDSMSSTIVRLIQNWLHKQSNSRTYTLNHPLYNESSIISLSAAYTGAVGAFVQLQYKSNDPSGNEEYEAGDVVAEGRVTSADGTNITVSVTDGQFVHNATAYNVVAGSQTLESTSVSQESLSYNMQLYALVREDQTNVLKYMPITRDDMMNQKNDMMDGSVTALLDTSAVFSRLVNFGERAEAAGDISTPVAITDADAPLFVIRQNHFTSVGSNDQDVSESSAWGDPFVVPILD